MVQEYTGELKQWIFFFIPIFSSKLITRTVKLHGFCLTILINYKWVGEGSTKKLTTLFNKFKPNTVSSQFTLTDKSSGSEHLPSTVRVIKQGFEVLKISLLKHKHNPDASSSLAAIGISTEAMKRFALLSIFNARLLQISRNLSFTNELSFLSLSDSLMWSMNVQLLHIM